MAGSPIRLAEKYRPRTWPEVYGQGKALSVLETLRRHGGLCGRHYALSGKSGTGKTTIAELIAAEIADSFCITRHVARHVTADMVRGWIDELGYIPMGARLGRVFIVNELHELPRHVVSPMLDLLERAPVWCTFIFTTTVDGMEIFEEGVDAHPFLDRCTTLSLTSQGLSSAFAPRLREIAQAEGLDGQPVEAYARLIQRECHGSLRKALELVERGAMLADTDTTKGEAE